MKTEIVMDTHKSIKRRIGINNHIGDRIKFFRSFLLKCHISTTKSSNEAFLYRYVTS